tara:strand:- start:25 stop:666 length:642 start_codon:yes stop_codon:yes gene_type:complete
MAIKKPARTPNIPPGEIITEEDDLLAALTPAGGMNEQVDTLPEPTPEEEEQVDMVLGAVTDSIWDDKYDEVLDKLKKGESDLPKTIGELGAELLFEEVMAALEQGIEVSNNIKLSIAAEINFELAELAASQKLIEFKSDEHAQKFQGEALIYGLERYGELGDPTIDPEETIDVAQKILAGEQPEGIVAPKRGFREDMAPEGMAPSPTPAVGVT